MGHRHQQKDPSGQHTSGLDWCRLHTNMVFKKGHIINLILIISLYIARDVGSSAKIGRGRHSRGRTTGGSANSLSK